MTQQTIDTHPSFRMKCICRKASHSFLISKPGSETRRESMCYVCAAQIEALGYTTKMVGR